MTKTGHQLRYTDLDPIYERMDGQRYPQLTKATRGPKQTTNPLEVNSQVTFGQGRQLLPWLDRKRNLEIRELAAKPSRWPGREEAKGMKHTPEFLGYPEHHVSVLTAAGRGPGPIRRFDDFVLGIDNVPGLAPTISAYNAISLVNQDYAQLITATETCAGQQKPLSEGKKENGPVGRGASATGVAVICDE